MLKEIEKSISVFGIVTRYYLCKLLKSADKVPYQKRKRGSFDGLGKNIY